MKYGDRPSAMTDCRQVSNSFVHSESGSGWLVVNAMTPGACASS